MLGIGQIQAAVCLGGSEILQPEFTINDKNEYSIDQ